MAIYHLNVKNISRGDGRSVVTAAGYRAWETLPNEAEERMSDFAVSKMSPADRRPSLGANCSKSASICRILAMFCLVLSSRRPCASY
ncbi:MULTISPECIES: hypothetical protein [Rhizobium/Agrobacterium group]|uniref:Uncharacterized protein n=2 Tax=Neorhizobium TaxID=1525371 RepID=A0ABV0M2U4_9HYPH|nr:MULTISPECIES: hypothetical protein [Rhizobium/Agrobacterium group]MCC2609546.1 hypothetical protein [Neorhizobium petrolearium]WGI69751.1 hypothetical protein QEO92_06715 [Neorhizobium petrolearium]